MLSSGKRSSSQKGRNWVNLIDFEEDPYEGPSPKDRVATLKAELSAMTLQEKEQLANEMGIGEEEDFPTV